MELGCYKRVWLWYSSMVLTVIVIDLVTFLTIYPYALAGWEHCSSGEAGLLQSSTNGGNSLIHRPNRFSIFHFVVCVEKVVLHNGMSAHYRSYSTSVSWFCRATKEVCPVQFSPTPQQPDGCLTLLHFTVLNSGSRAMQDIHEGDCVNNMYFKGSSKRSSNRNSGCALFKISVSMLDIQRPCRCRPLKLKIMFEQCLK